MKHLFFSLLLVTCAALLPLFTVADIIKDTAGERDVRYVSIMPDLPLPPGFEEMRDDTILWEQGSANIATVTLKSQHTRADMTFLKDYKTTLEGLGWTGKSPEHMVRAGDTIRVEVKENGTKLVLTIISQAIVSFE